MGQKSTNLTPEVWGGIECSFNRVGDQYMDQLLFSDHYRRGVADIERFASLGITAMRYPVLWERHKTAPSAQIDWSWTEQQLHAMQHHRIRPIVGLLHHGNGPPYTNLLRESFADDFAAYALEVARKFPWIEYYTPINEPLTTARFCGLYGLWFPHCRNDQAFARILLNQMKGTVLAMEAIRTVNPHAKLLQTEDFSKTFSTPLLDYQADFENERRWLTIDLLFGKVMRGHYFWAYFKSAGIGEKELAFFSDHPCPPHIIGADYYHTSERYLDEDIMRYPAEKRGGNGRHQYADVEAVRIRNLHDRGPEYRLRECWDRYKLPLAVTEVHVNGSPDDQIRWFSEVWSIARKLLAEGIPVKGVTAWALLGSYGWNNLLVYPNGHYEPGAFHISAGIPVATPLVPFIRSLAENPALTALPDASKSWWHAEERFIYDTVLSNWRSIA
ncbi:MAG TPA: family 1 glycosylhydrolase [Ohtaekwangia sp.]|nr:family 1 glycosylhydrolase [Ohtaekwangia sp.]